MRPEDRLQSRCAKYLKAALPAPAFYSGIEHARKQSVFAGAVQKAKGIKRGLADLNIWYRGQFIGIELKVASPVSSMQDAFGKAMHDNGFNWRVVRSVVELHDYLAAELFIPIPASMRSAAMHHDAALSLPEPERTRTPGPARKAKPSRAQIAAGHRFYEVSNS